MEEMHMVRYGGKGTKLPCPLQVPLSLLLQLFTSSEALQIPPLWFLEKKMAALSSILAWKIPWTEEPGRLQFMGSLRVGHD